MLELQLNVRRGSFHLQVDCCFTADWTVLFGPSGAGKSTLLRLIAGLDRSDARSDVAKSKPDRIILDSTVLSDSAAGLWVQPGRRHTALVAQQQTLFPHLSVAANVGYGITALDRSTRAARIAEVLNLVGASDLVDRRPRNLSGGEDQRVALARALAPQPRLLLLDEPFSAMDGAASDALLDRLQPWLRAQSVQTILATHDATDAFSTAAEVALIRAGTLISQGPASTVLASERERLQRRLNIL